MYALDDDGLPMSHSWMRVMRSFLLGKSEERPGSSPFADEPGAHCWSGRRSPLLDDACWELEAVAQKPVTWTCCCDSEMGWRLVIRYASSCHHQIEVDRDGQEQVSRQAQRQWQQPPLQQCPYDDSDDE
jgi:hypothetical protein